MKPISAHLLSALLTVQCCVPVSTALTLQIEAIGNPDNPPDVDGIGTVAETFEAMKFEVTVSQYTEFLNSAAAQEDPSELWSLSMDSVIERGGAPGSWHYAVAPGISPDEPLRWVSVIQALHLAGWLSAGAPVDSSVDRFSSGSYELDALPALVRSEGGYWYLPNFDEARKAMTYDPDTDEYYAWAVGSDTPPVAEPPPGSATGANFDNVIGRLAKVGAYPQARSPFGLHDGAGSVAEFVEPNALSGCPVETGGSFASGIDALRSNYYSSACVLEVGLDTKKGTAGFRLVRRLRPRRPPGVAVFRFGSRLAGAIKGLEEVDGVVVSAQSELVGEDLQVVILDSEIDVDLVSGQLIDLTTSWSSDVAEGLARVSVYRAREELWVPISTLRLTGERDTYAHVGLPAADVVSPDGKVAVQLAFIASTTDAPGGFQVELDTVAAERYDAP